MSLPEEIAPVRIIIVNNDFAETSYIKVWLEKDMRVPWRISHCISVDEARSRVKKADLVILKPEMDGFSSPKEVFKDIDKMLFEIPIIVLTSKGDERGLSTYVMEQGAADTLIRGQFTRLVDAIEFALIRQKIKTNVRKTNDKTLIESEDKGKADLKISNDDNLIEEERHKQILRMFSGDYTVDPQEK